MYPIYTAGEESEQEVDRVEEEDLLGEEEEDEEEEDNGQTQTVKVALTVTAPPGTSVADIEAIIKGALKDESIDVDSMETEQVAS